MSSEEKNKLSRELVQEIRRANKDAAYFEIMGRKRAACESRKRRGRLNLLLTIVERKGVAR